MKLIDRIIAFPEMDDKCASYENAYYISKDKNTLIRIRTLEISSDIHEHCSTSYSYDDGNTWSAPERFDVSRKTPEGVYRRDYGTPFTDPVNGRLIVVATQSFLPGDNTFEALTHSYQTYRVSVDGGKTWEIDEQIIQKDSAGRYTKEHPVEGMWIGRNSLHPANEPLRSSTGKLLWPAQRTKLRPDGKLFCPPGAASYHEMILLIGTWRDDCHVDWEVSREVRIEPEKSTRGAIEGAVAEMPDGRMLMVMRGSNDGNLKLRGYKWYCISNDGGYVWDEPRPWGYSDGNMFFSPSSYSRILKHSNGKYYWFGNICPENPKGNLPRYPFVAGEIDPDCFLLVKKSLIELDTCRNDDKYPPQMGNFTVYEERSTGNFILRMTRLWVDEKNNMRGSSYIYRVEC